MNENQLRPTSSAVDLRIRTVLYGFVIFLLVATLVAVVGPKYLGESIVTFFTWCSIIAVAGAVGYSYYLAIQHAREQRGQAKLPSYVPVTTKHRKPSSQALLIALSILSWVGLYSLANTFLVVLAGIAVLLTLGIECYILQKKLRGYSARAILLMTLALSWITASIIVYLRIVKHS